MTTHPSPRALVLGGSGYIGEAILRRFAAADVPCAFTYCTSEDKAQALGKELGHQPMRVDFRDRTATVDWLRRIDFAPEALVHAAAYRQARADRDDRSDRDDVDEDAWDEALAVHATVAFSACRLLADKLAATHANVVLLGAIDGQQCVPIAPHVAAAQGALLGYCKALAKALGPFGVRVNLVCPGVQDGGVARALDRRVHADFLTHSAFGRVGSADETARAVVWLALHNTYMSGATVAVNGGF